MQQGKLVYKINPFKRLSMHSKLKPQKMMHTLHETWYFIKEKIVNSYMAKEQL